MISRIGKSAARLPRSGDRLTDWFFRQFVHFLRKETVCIKRKRRLVNPDDPHREAIRGLMDPEVHPSGRYVHILINPARDANRTRDDEADTLIHELSHVVLGKTTERHVLQLESILSARFTLLQRRIIKSFLPRHVVKRYPRISSRATLPRPRIMVL